MDIYEVSDLKEFSSPFIEERLYLEYWSKRNDWRIKFSSPFIEERLYLVDEAMIDTGLSYVLVPFYRGAVVFEKELYKQAQFHMEFSSPFIEERLYFLDSGNIYKKHNCSRPLLSRSGCIFN